MTGVADTLGSAPPNKIFQLIPNQPCQKGISTQIIPKSENLRGVLIPRRIYGKAGSEF